ncbi:MAG: hypothetical protein AAF329_13000 [Cyanobacteria bacterium P01_A01_bin.17]
MGRTEFENYLFELLDAKDTPQPKYKFFQRATHGVIVGMCWCSVEYGFRCQIRPG